MKTLTSKLKQLKHKKLITTLILLLLLISFTFPRLGTWLVTSDEPQEADVIVVLMGSVPDRILEATDLYHEGYSDKLLMVNSHMVGYDALLARGVEIPGDAQLTQIAASSLQVPEEAIKILPGQAKSTQDEAIIILDYLKENKEINSLILVTSKYHSSRSEKIFTKAFDNFDRDITIISRPSKYDNFNPEYWWQDREDIQRVVTEYIKFINYYLVEQFQL